MSNIRELEHQDSIFNNIQKALLMVREFSKKEDIARKQLGGDYQKVFDIFMPEDKKDRFTYSLEDQIESLGAIAYASPETKTELDLWDSMLVETLKLKCRNKDTIRLIALIIINIGITFKRACGEHITNTYDIYMKIIYTMTNYSTEASSSHQYLLEGEMAKVFREQSKLLKDKNKNKKEEKQEDLTKLLG